MEPHELERLRRSIGMLAPAAASGLSREQALQVLGDLKQADQRLRDLRRELRRLADQD
jgi:hypothetical protein